MTDIIRIRVVDLETTGFPPDAEPIEIAAVDLIVRPFHLPRIADDAAFALVRPQRAMPATASAIHHLTDDDLMDAPLWGDVWPLFVDPAIGAWAAHSAKFEMAFLTPAIIGTAPWICTHKCALRLWPEAPGHSNQVLRYWLKPPGLDRRKAALAHRAYPDAYVTAHLLALMIERASVDQLVAWSAEPALLARVPFGTHKGGRWADVDDGFLDWVLARSFDEDVMFTARKQVDKRLRERGEEARADALWVDDDHQDIAA
jgi:exodeoxyribonuclease X